MSSALKTTVTMLTLLALLVGGALWGLAQVTRPLPQAVDVPACSMTPVAKGTRVFPDQIVVNVRNAGTRSGLARRTMGLLTEIGFVEGTSGNTDREVRVAKAQVWAADVQDPGALLVATYLGATVVKKPADSLEPGVTVVVGDDFGKLKPGRKSIKARADTEICLPPDSL